MEKDVFSISRFQSLEEKKGQGRKLNIVKNHILKTFLLPGKVNGPLNNIFTLKKKNPYFWTCSQMHQKRYPIGFRSKKDIKMFLSFYSWNYPLSNHS